jgi:hypothetical protein
VKASGAGFVTKIRRRAYYLSRYRIEKVGGAIHTEYWIPAEDLPKFKRNIAGPIVVSVFDQPGDGCFNVDKREFVDQFLAFRTCLAFPQQLL